MIREFLAHRLPLLSLILWLMLVSVTGCSLNFAGSTGSEVAVISGAPVVQLAAPLPNSTYLQGVGVNILVSITNAGTDIARVEVKVDDTLIAEVATPNPSGAARFSVTRTWTAEPGTHTVSAAAYRSDGTASAPVTVQINVVEALPATDTPLPPTATATVTLAPTAAATTAVPTVNTVATGGTDAPAATATSSTVRVKIVEGGMNVRRGPSTNFVPALGVLTGEVDILATNQDATWFRITFQGGEAWISASPTLVTVIAGDVNNLPRETGPAIPTLAPPTSAPPTTAPPTNAQATSTGAPSGGANLQITGFELIPAIPSRGVPAIARVNIFNSGSQATTAGGNVIVAIADVNGQGNPVFGSVTIPTINAQANFLVEIPFTDNTNIGVQRGAVAIVDPENAIPETNDNDNTSSPLTYTMAG